MSPEPSRHDYWAHALVAMVQEIEDNGYQVNVDDFGIQVWSLDMEKKTRMALTDGSWKIDE